MENKEKEMLQEQLDREAKTWGYRNYQEYLSEAETVEHNTIVEKFYDKLNESESVKEYYDPEDEMASIYDDADATIKAADAQAAAEQEARDWAQFDKEQEETGNRLEQFFQRYDAMKLNKIQKLSFVKGFYYIDKDSHKLFHLGQNGPKRMMPKNGVYVFKTKIGEPREIPEEEVNNYINEYFG